ncbi:MAG: beta-1,3-glucosyltransferase, partial [bacterium]|nr:beta-1,3-glucosyltransferase [bacterium]
IVGKVGKGHKSVLSPDFYNSEYAKNWKNLLHSKELTVLAQQYGYDVIFFPHANIQPYMDWFDLPKSIKAMSNKHGFMQELFQKASLMITDYSSVAFEMAVLRRAVIYYQFDHNDVFSGAHTYQKGYFDYIKDGFGPVCYEENQIIERLTRFIEQGVINQKYLERMENFFYFHDMDNCKRTFNAIKNLDKFY